MPHESASSPKPNSDGLTGGVRKEQGHIHRGMLIRDYYGFQLHEGGLQPSIRTMNGFRDYLHLSVSGPIVPSFVARVSPGRFGAYGPIVAPTFLCFSSSGPSNVRLPRGADWQLKAGVLFVISLERTPYGTN